MITLANYLVYGLVGVLSISGAFMFFSINTNSVDQRQMQYRIQLGWNQLWGQVKENKGNAALIRMFNEVGFRVNPSTFRYVRMISTGASLLLAIYFFETTASIVNFALPIIVWWCFSYRIPISPLHSILTMLKTVQDRRKQREIFLLYSLTKDELVRFEGEGRNLRSMFAEFTLFFNVLRPTLETLLRNWNTDTNRALDRFVEEVNHPNIEPFARMIRQIQQSNIESALDILDSQFQTIQDDAVATFSSRTSIHSVLGTAFGTVSFVLVLTDFTTLTTLYSSTVMSHIV